MSKDNRKDRKEYSKPILNVIDLAADEVLAGNCKANGMRGARQPGTCLHPIACFQPGS